VVNYPSLKVFSFGRFLSEILCIVAINSVVNDIFEE
jgi:hypothetical protein